MAKKRLENPPTEAQPSKPAKAKPAKAKPAKKRVAGELPWHPFWRWSARPVGRAASHSGVQCTVGFDDGRCVTARIHAAGRRARPTIASTTFRKHCLAKASRDAWDTSFFSRLSQRALSQVTATNFSRPIRQGRMSSIFQVMPADGKVVEGRLPSLDLQWPRLFYHRHMMLAEQTRLMEESALHYANHLATLHGGPSQLELKMHLLLPPHRVADETPLDAPSTFQSIGAVTGRPRPSASPSEPASQLPAPQPGVQQ